MLKIGNFKIIRINITVKIIVTDVFFEDHFDESLNHCYKLVVFRFNLRLEGYFHLSLSPEFPIHLHKKHRFQIWD
jgi:hypothetical protein